MGTEGKREGSKGEGSKPRIPAPPVSGSPVYRSQGIRSQGFGLGRIGWERIGYGGGLRGLEAYRAAQVSGVAGLPLLPPFPCSRSPGLRSLQVSPVPSVPQVAGLRSKLVDGRGDRIRYGEGMRVEGWRDEGSPFPLSPRIAGLSRAYFPATRFPVREPVSLARLMPSPNCGKSKFYIQCNKSIVASRYIRMPGKCGKLGRKCG